MKTRWNRKFLVFMNFSKIDDGGGGSGGGGPKIFGGKKIFLWSKPITSQHALYGIGLILGIGDI